MKKILYVMIITVVGLYALVKITNGIDRYMAAPQVASLSVNQSQPGYTLSEKEAYLLNFFLEDEAVAFSKGIPGLLNGDLPTTPVSKVSEAYNENQVAADQLYFNKLLFLSGSIQSINSGINNEPYIAFYGTNPFLFPQAHFQDDNAQKIARLRKGQRIHLVCRGNGVIVGTPMFKDCQFSEDYANNRFSEIKLQIKDFLAGKEAESKRIVIVSILAIYVARELPGSSACFINEKKCSKDIGTLFKGDALPQKMFDIANEMRSLGLQVPDAREMFHKQSKKS